MIECTHGTDDYKRLLNTLKFLQNRMGVVKCSSYIMKDIRPTEYPCRPSNPVYMLY